MKEIKKQKLISCVNNDGKKFQLLLRAELCEVDPLDINKLNS